VGLSTPSDATSREQPRSLGISTRAWYVPLYAPVLSHTIPLDQCKVYSGYIDMPKNEKSDMLAPKVCL
jgi:hypothetical protein